MSNNRDLGRLAANLTVNGQEVGITNVPTPTNDSDVATKKYVDDNGGSEVTDSNAGLIPAYPSDISGGQYEVFWGAGEGWRSSGVGVYNGKEGSEEIVYHPNNGVAANRFTQQSVDDDTLEVHKADSSTLEWRVKDGGISSGKLATGSVISGKIADGTITYPLLDTDGTAGQFLAINSAGTNWEWVNPPSEFSSVSGDITIDASDVATITAGAIDYPKIDITGTAGQILTVNSDGTNWEWADAAEDFTSITGDINIDSSNVARLQPGSVRYDELDQQTNVAGRVLTSTGSDWEWKDIEGLANDSVGYDELDAGSSTAGQILTVNSSNDGLEWADAPSTDTLNDIGNVNAGGHTEGQVLTWNGTSEEWVNRDLPNWIEGNNGNDFATAPSASGGNSIAIGDEATASEYGNISIGTEADATGTESLVVGHQSTASHNYSSAFGWRAASTGDYDLVLGGKEAAVLVNPTVAGHESHSNQLVSKEYVDSRIASQNAVVSDSELRNALTTLGSGSVTNDAFANYTHFGRTGLQQAVGTTAESYYYCSGFFSNTNPNQVNNGPLTHFPTALFDRVSGGDLSPTLGQDGTQYDSFNSAYPEVFRYKGKNGLRVWAEDDITVFAQFGWRNFSDSDVSNFTVPEARIRLQLVALPHNLQPRSLNESNAVVILTSNWNHLARQSLSLINDGTSYTVDDADDYYNFTVPSRDAEKAVTINKGDFLAWRWQYHFVNTHNSNTVEEFDILSDYCFEVNSRYRSSANGTNDVYSLPIDYEIPVPEHELILHPDTDATNGDLIYLDNTDTDNPIEHLLWDASAAEIPPGALNGNVIINAISDDTNGSIELTKANGDSVDFTRSYSDWDRTLDYDDGTTVTYNDRIYRANRDVSAVPDWDTDSSYSAGTTVFYVDKFYTALFSRDSDDPAPADDGSNWRVTEAVQPQRNPSWDALTPVTGGTNQVASSDEETPANAYGQDTIAIGAGARAGEQVIVNFTGITYYSDTLVQLLGATYNGSPISSSNSITIVADTIVTVTQGTNVVDLTMSGDNTLNQSSPLLITTGDGDELVNGNTPGTLTLGQGQDALALGNGAVANHTSSVVIGKDGSSTADNQLLISDEITSIRLDGFTGGDNQFLAIDANGDLSAASAGVADGNITGASVSSNVLTLNQEGGSDITYGGGRLRIQDNQSTPNVDTIFTAGATSDLVLTFEGGNNVTTTVSNNKVRIDASASVMGGDVFLYDASTSYTNGQVVLFQGEWWRWASASASNAGDDPTNSTGWRWCGVPILNSGTIKDNYTRVDLQQDELSGSMYAEISNSSINAAVDQAEFLELDSYSTNSNDSVAEDVEQVSHNFGVFNRANTGTVEGSDVQIVDYYRSSQSSLSGYAEALPSRIIKPYKYNQGDGNTYPNGWVVKTFHYDSNELLRDIYIVWIDVDTDDSDNSIRNALFGSNGDTDVWSSSDNSDLTPVATTTNGHVKTGYWTGFDLSNSNVTLGNSGNVRLLGHQRLYYDSNDLVINTLYFGRDPT